MCTRLNPRVRPDPLRSNPIHRWQYRVAAVVVTVAVTIGTLEIAVAPRLAVLAVATIHPFSVTTVATITICTSITTCTTGCSTTMWLPIITIIIAITMATGGKARTIIPTEHRSVALAA